MSHPVDSYKPLSSRILVRPDPEATHVGLIEIPQTAREKHTEKNRLRFGTVVALGPGMLMKNGERWRMPDVKPGDRILYSHEGAYKIKLEVAGEDVLHHSIRDTFVAGVVEE